MENKYILMLKNLAKEVVADTKKIFNMNKMTEADVACLGIFNDFHDDEIRSQPLSVRYAWEVGREVSKRLEKTNK